MIHLPHQCASLLRSGVGTKIVWMMLVPVVMPLVALNQRPTSWEAPKPTGLTNRRRKPGNPRCFLDFKTPLLTRHLSVLHSHSLTKGEGGQMMCGTGAGRGSRRCKHLPLHTKHISQVAIHPRYLLHVVRLGSSSGLRT